MRKIFTWRQFKQIPWIILCDENAFPPKNVFHSSALSNCIKRAQALTSNRSEPASLFVASPLFLDPPAWSVPASLKSRFLWQTIPSHSLWIGVMSLAPTEPCTIPLSKVVTSPAASEFLFQLHACNGNVSEKQRNARGKGHARRTPPPSPPSHQVDGLPRGTSLVFSIFKFERRKSLTVVVRPEIFALTYEVN